MTTLVCGGCCCRFIMSHTQIEEEEKLRLQEYAEFKKYWTKSYGQHLKEIFVTRKIAINSVQLYRIDLAISNDLKHIAYTYDVR